MVCKRQKYVGAGNYLPEIGETGGNFGEFGNRV